MQQNGADKYNSTYTIAKGFFYQAEQAFKFIPGAGSLKADMFDKLLLNKVPGLTQDEINHFREAIAGEVTTQLSVSQILAPAYDQSKDEADAKHTASTDAISISDPANTNTPLEEIKSTDVSQATQTVTQ
jgi:hypothetical protein